MVRPAFRRGRGVRFSPGDTAAGLGGTRSPDSRARQCNAWRREGFFHHTEANVMPGDVKVFFMSHIKPPGWSVSPFGEGGELVVFSPGDPRVASCTQRDAYLYILSPCNPSERPPPPEGHAPSPPPAAPLFCRLRSRSVDQAAICMVRPSLGNTMLLVWHFHMCVSFLLRPDTGSSQGPM